MPEAYFQERNSLKGVEGGYEKYVWVGRQGACLVKLPKGSRRETKLTDLLTIRSVITRNSLKGVDKSWDE